MIFFGKISFSIRLLQISSKEPADAIIIVSRFKYLISSITNKGTSSILVKFSFCEDIKYLTFILFFF
jgi:hypothetical protein